MTEPKISLDDQIKCVGREIGVRKNVYPQMIAREKKGQAECDREIAAMEAVYATLKWLKANEATVRAAVEPTKATP